MVVKMFFKASQKNLCNKSCERLFFKTLQIKSFIKCKDEGKIARQNY